MIVRFAHFRLELTIGVIYYISGSQFTATNEWSSFQRFRFSFLYIHGDKTKYIAPNFFAHIHGIRENDRNDVFFFCISRG